MNGSHWHDCRIVLRPGQLLISARHYVADGRPPAGRSVAVLPVRMPDDSERADQLESLAAATWRPTAPGRATTPTDVVATVDRVTITSGPHMVDLRAEGIAAFGSVKGFRGRLAWVAHSLCDRDEGEFLVRVDLGRSSRPPRHRTLLLTLDTSLAPVDLPDVGTLVQGSHYANGHVAMAGTVGSSTVPDAPWLAGWLLTAPDVISLPRRPHRRAATSNPRPAGSSPPPRSSDPGPPNPGSQPHPTDEEPF